VTSPAPDPRVSVVVATVGGRDTLRSTIQAVLAQRPAPHEVIVVESGPRRGPGASAEATPGCVHVRVPEAGATRARNAGLACATGHVVAFTDDDAVPEAGWLEAILGEFADERVGAVGGRVEPPDALHGEQLAVASALGLTGFGRGDRLELDLANPDWFAVAAFGAMAVGPNMAFRRTALLEIGGFDERLGPGTPLGGAEEGYAFLQLVQRGYRVVRSPLPVVRHPLPAPSAEAMKRYTRRGLAAMTGYPVFLLAVGRGLRMKVLRYVLEGAIGRARPWRSGAAGVPVSDTGMTPPSLIPLHARLAEYVRGIARGLASARAVDSAESLRSGKGPAPTP
jgi:glycosyltransferase involved in cell wall biosynthesis